MFITVINHFIMEMVTKAREQNSGISNMEKEGCDGTDSDVNIESKAVPVAADPFLYVRTIPIYFHEDCSRKCATWYVLS